MQATERDELIRAAIAARDNAYAPYSEFAVGAALLATGGKVYSGCNVENASYGLTICAERVALATAVADGHQSFEAIAIASDGAVSPCGACLQVLAEFCEHLTILLTDEQGNDLRVSDLNAMLPDRFAG